MENVLNATFNAVDVNRVHKPLLLRIDNPDDLELYNKLMHSGKISFLHDEIMGQLKELIKSKNPSIKLKPDDYPDLINKHLDGRNLQEYGVWAYYPWSQRMVHLLDKEEFVEMRTNRNQYKITRNERDTLGTKKIGIIGLSVGQSIALTLAMERGFGELRLADFDELELSNLNRIRTGLHNLGLPKVVIAAREIAEIDPFLNVSCFFDGLIDANIDDFFLKNGKLDILVDECDSLDVKITSRIKARELKIPVVMDTSDRGMLDVERFDLEPDRAILHGALENVDPTTIKGLSNEDKIPIILRMLGIENVSLRLKASMVEVEQTINTWPQLASSVALGGAVGADVCRRILLGQFHDSGRYYVDLEGFVGTKQDPPKVQLEENPHRPLQLEEMKALSGEPDIDKLDGQVAPETEIIKDLVTAAIWAPSTGNDQPWKWLYKDGVLNLYHDEYRSWSFGDYKKLASFITLGAAYENLYIRALKNGLRASYEFFPNKGNEKLVASIRFTSNLEGLDANLLELDKAIFKRHTNRNPAPKQVLSADVFQQLKMYTESIKGAEMKIFTDEEQLKALGEIIGACDRARFLSPRGHHDFVNHEIRWSSQEAEHKKDGIDVKTLGFTNSQLAALNVIKDENVVGTLRNLGGGYALDMLAKRIVKTASALCMITLPEYNLHNYFEGGRAMERFWLAATNLNLAVHPVISPFYLFPRVIYGNGEGLNSKTVEELSLLRENFKKLTGLEENKAEVFLTKVAIAEEPVLKSFRLPLNEVLYIES